VAAQEAHAAPAAQPVPATVPATADSTAAGLAARAGDQAVHGTAPATVGQVAAQGRATPAQAVDIITPHITTRAAIEYPCLSGTYAMLTCEAHLPQWAPLHVGGLTIDLSPTKHVVMLLLAALLCCVVLIGAARAHTRHSHAGRATRRASPPGSRRWCSTSATRSALKNLGHHGEKYVPFILTLFFFILFANLLGLIPTARRPPATSRSRPCSRSSLPGRRSSPGCVRRGPAT
jgi:F-type H+-transporting ATPase subunit a